MKARVWKENGLWNYRTYMTTEIGAIAVHGYRPTWRQAFDAACQELKWMNGL